jgi:hypothetical protein
MVGSVAWVMRIFLSCFEVVGEEVGEWTKAVIRDQKESLGDNRDIRKVRKRQGQYPEFGHTHGEIQRKPAKKYISIQVGSETQETIS